ncbi:hypothetical protein [Niveispirillum lacus]|nr:hypothetical protein [Niveispirillum lacus]
MLVFRAILMVALAAAVIIPCMLPTRTAWPSLDEADPGLARKFNLDPAFTYRSRPDPDAPVVALPKRNHPVYAIALVEDRVWIGLEDASTGRFVWIEEDLVRRPPDPR